MRLFQYLIIFFCINAAVASPLSVQHYQEQQRINMYRMFSPFYQVAPAKNSEKTVMPEKITPVKSNTSKSKRPLSTKKNSKALKKITKKNNLLTTLTTVTPSALGNREKKENTFFKNPFGIMFFKPTYILPYYYTSSPYGNVYRGQTPDNQRVSPDEFKAQLSIKVPIVRHFFGKHSGFYLGYTQLSYWQFYSKSQYFRETNYEPELFWEDRIIGNWWFNLGIVHQSNGRGGAMERSWNRLYVDIKFSGEHWMVSWKPWLLIFKKESSDFHNPNISKYLGHGRFLFAYRIGKNEFSFMSRNNLESGFKRGAVEFDYSFPIYGALSGYTQFFAGYGQSLIEYDHSTKGVGIGISLSNWI